MKYSNQQIEEARKKVLAKKGFYQHLMSYILVNFFLLVLNLLTTPDSLWVVYPLLGWGIGLAFHYVEVFGIPGFDVLSKEWEEKEMEKELKSMAEKGSTSSRISTGLLEERPRYQPKKGREEDEESDFA
ncbi:MAG: hypothetical protein RI973_490 [Bacteroidota bacterium]|jgi:glucan phosphoethanolaminetransferase (alkaline phosphatase superfamily)